MSTPLVHHAIKMAVHAGGRLHYSKLWMERAREWREKGEREMVCRCAKWAREAMHDYLTLLRMAKEMI